MDGLIQAFIDYFGVPAMYRIPAIIAALVTLAMVAYVGRRLQQWLKWRSQTSLQHIDVQLHTLTFDATNQPHLEWEGVGKLSVADVAEWQHLARAVQSAAMQTEHGRECVVLGNVDQHDQFLNQLVSMAGALPKLALIASEMDYPVYQGLLVCEKYAGIPARLKLFLVTEEQLVYFSASSFEARFADGKGLRSPHHIERVRTLYRMGQIAISPTHPREASLRLWWSSTPVWFRVIRDIRAGRSVAASGIVRLSNNEQPLRRITGA
ncbi:MAG: hypothetical protein KBE09_01120 [Candidatus Pacebacteria bacterium]|nr:hypothetical protein [Candidatus Paceibacterota bacterium]